LVKNRGIIPGGGAPEIEMSQKLAEFSRTLGGVESLVVRAFADALEVIPYTLSENAGLNPIIVVTELRNRHIKGEKEVGINVKKGITDNMLTENVIQPALVTTSALSLATEVVRMILKIDDLVRKIVNCANCSRFLLVKLKEGGVMSMITKGLLFIVGLKFENLKQKFCSHGLGI
jgi:T-complex protein 1 subunit delta